MPNWHRRSADGAIVLAIRAQPGARRTQVVGLHGDWLKVRIAAPALEDRANQALLEFLAERFAVPRKQVALVGGARSREKRIEIRGSDADPEEALEVPGAA